MGFGSGSGVYWGRVGATLARPMFASPKSEADLVRVRVRVRVIGFGLGFGLG